MLCPNGTVKPFLVSLVEPVAYLKSELRYFNSFEFLDHTGNLKAAHTIPADVRSIKDVWAEHPKGEAYLERLKEIAKKNH
jgi:hypothetical protein